YAVGHHGGPRRSSGFRRSWRPEVARASARRGARTTRRPARQPTRTAPPRARRLRRPSRPSELPPRSPCSLLADRSRTRSISVDGAHAGPIRAGGSTVTQGRRSQPRWLTIGSRLLLHRKPVVDVLRANPPVTRSARRGDAGAAQRP